MVTAVFKFHILTGDHFAAAFAVYWVKEKAAEAHRTDIELFKGRCILPMGFDRMPGIFKGFSALAADIHYTSSSASSLTAPSISCALSRSIIVRLLTAQPMTCPSAVSRRDLTAWPQVMSTYRLDLRASDKSRLLGADSGSKTAYT